MSASQRVHIRPDGDQPVQHPHVEKPQNSKRLIGAFTLLVVILLAIGGLSVVRAVAVETDLVDITERRMAVIADMGLVRDEGNFQDRAIRNIALFTDPTRIAQESEPAIEDALTQQTTGAQRDQARHGRRCERLGIVLNLSRCDTRAP